MAPKCVHKGCGKPYTDENEVCKYHPGPPIFHEGQKGETRRDRHPALLSCIIVEFAK
jgi:CHORD protein